jgi:hypothetical protein
MGGCTAGMALQVVDLPSQLVAQSRVPSLEAACDALDASADAGAHICFQVHVAAGWLWGQARPGRYKVGLFLLTGAQKESDVATAVCDALGSEAAAARLGAHFMSPLLRVHQQDFRWFACTVPMEVGVRKVAVVVSGVSDYANRAGPGLGPHFTAPCLGFLPQHRVHELNTDMSALTWRHVKESMDANDSGRDQAERSWMDSCVPVPADVLVLMQPQLHAPCPPDDGLLARPGQQNVAGLQLARPGQAQRALVLQVAGSDGRPTPLVRTAAVGCTEGGLEGAFDDLLDLPQPWTTEMMQLQGLEVTFAIKTVRDLMCGIVTTTRATYGALPRGSDEVPRPICELDRGSTGQAQPEGLRPVEVRCRNGLRELRGMWGVAWPGLDRLEAGAPSRPWDALETQPAPGSSSSAPASSRAAVVVRHDPAARLAEAGAASSSSSDDPRVRGFFSFTAPPGFCIAGLHGSAGPHLHSIGVYFAPCVPRHLPLDLVSLGGGSSEADRAGAAAWARRHLPQELRRGVGELMLCMLGLHNRRVQQAACGGDWSWGQVVPRIVQCLVDQCYHSYSGLEQAGYSPLQWEPPQDGEQVCVES